MQSPLYVLLSVSHTGLHLLVWADCFVSLLLTTENDDYRLARTTVMFDSEQEESCVTLEAVNDIITEGAETFDLCLEEYSVSTTVVIRDNDGRCGNGQTS